MKHENAHALIPTGIVVLFLTALSSKAEPVAEKPGILLPITRVMIYEDRALIERSGSVAIEAGVYQVRISRLPVGLVEASLRASLPDAAGARVLSVTSRTEERLETQDEKLRAFEKEQTGLEAQQRQLQARVSVLNSEKAYLQQFQRIILKSLSERTTLGTVKAEEIRSANEFLSKRRTEVSAAQRDISLKTKLLTEKMSDVQKNIAAIATPNRKTTRYADVVIESAAGGNIALTLNYLIGNASWRPRYEARLSGGKLDVQYMGEVRQGSGEPWDNVELVLSTARPSLGATRPVLAALRVGLQKAEAVKDLVSAVGDYAGAMGTPVTGEEAGIPTEGEVEVKESGTSVVFQLKGRYTIPSDRRASKVPITAFDDSSPKLSFETTPKLLRYVYLKCETSNKTSFPMLPGQVDIFRESGFMGTSHLAFVSPGRALKLSFGIDEELKVQRVRDPKRTRVVRSGRKNIFRFVIDTEIANYKATKETVFVVDNYPVSDVEEAVVKLERETTRPTVNKEKVGRLQWDLVLDPGKKRTIHLEYTVTLPKDFHWNPFAGEDENAAPQDMNPSLGPSF